MPQPIAFLQKTFLTARAADRRRQTSRNLTDTGQRWKNADDGVQEIFVESVAQFVAAVESMDMQSHGKWGRCVFLQLSTPSTPSTLGSAAPLMQIDQVRLRVSRPAKLHVAAPDVSDALRQITRSRAQSRTAHRQEFPEVHHPPPHTPVTRLHTWMQVHQRGLSHAAAAVLLQHMGAARIHAGLPHAAFASAASSLHGVHPTMSRSTTGRPLACSTGRTLPSSRFTLPPSKAHTRRLTRLCGVFSLTKSTFHRR